MPDALPSRAPTARRSPRRPSARGSARRPRVSRSRTSASRLEPAIARALTRDEADPVEERMLEQIVRAAGAGRIDRHAQAPQQPVDVVDLARAHRFARPEAELEADDGLVRGVVEPVRPAW